MSKNYRISKQIHEVDYEETGDKKLKLESTYNNTYNTLNTEFQNNTEANIKRNNSRPKT
jgi:hypothetical protein